MEDLIQQMMVKQDNFSWIISQRTANIEGTVSTLSNQVTMLETQVGQMANQATLMYKLGKFPSNTEMNMKNMEHYNAIYLRMATEEVLSASTEQKPALHVRIP